MVVTIDPKDTLVLFALLLCCHLSIGFKKQPETDWYKLTQDELRRTLKVRPNVGVAKNVILFMGDGMGFSNIMATRVYNAQKNDITFEQARLPFERFPYSGISMTYNTDRMITDSAAAAAAYLCGEKVRSRTIGVNQNVILSNCDSVEGNELTSVLQHSNSAGKSTGIVTTTRLTHASPATAYGSSPDRKWETDSAVPTESRSKCKDLAKQLVEEHPYINVLLGGGRTKFLPKAVADPEYADKMGERDDGRDLTKEWINKKKADMPENKFAFVRNKAEFDQADESSVDHLFGMFEPGHMLYEVDRLNKSRSNWDEPSLKDMTIKAIQTLQKNKDKGYFLFVEGGRIDHAHHASSAFRALNDTMAFAEAVEAAVNMVDDKETLIVVTADHSHVFTVGGLPPIDNPIFGLAQKQVGGVDTEIHIADDGKPFTVLSYGNGPSWVYHYTDGNGNILRGRRNLTKDASDGKLDDPYYAQKSPVPLEDETHGGEDVGIYARGPMAHLFSGTHQQTFIAHTIMYASCVGPGLVLCEDDQSNYPSWPENHNMANTAGEMSMPLMASIMVVIMNYAFNAMIMSSN